MKRDKLIIGALIILVLVIVGLTIGAIKSSASRNTATSATQEIQGVISNTSTRDKIIKDSDVVEVAIKKDIVKESKPKKVKKVKDKKVKQKDKFPEYVLYTLEGCMYTQKDIDRIVKEIKDNEESLELAKCVWAESGNQSQLGKRLVCDTILNRVADDRFPSTIHGVISAPNQYAVYSNGALTRAIPDEETYIVVYEELAGCYNEDVLYFRTNHYFSFGTPVLHEGAHYFSK